MLRSRPLIGVVASALVGGALFFAADLHSGPIKGCKQPADESPPLNAEEELVAASKLMEAGSWEEARTKLDSLHFSSAHLEAAELSSRCSMELAAQRSILRARELFDEERYSDARHELYGVAMTSKKAEERTKLEADMSVTADGLLVEAQELSGQRHDRAKMVELRRVAGLIEELEPDLPMAAELQEVAADALEEIDSPDVVVRRLFEEGDVAAAFKKAKSCSHAAHECEQLVEPLALLAAAKPKLKSYSTARLQELKQTARDVSSAGEGIEEDIDDVLSARFETAARKCKAAGDWACVDRQLAAALENQVAYDEGLEDALNAWAKATVTRAYSVRVTDPKAFRALMQRVAKMSRVESRWRELAQRLDEHVAAGR